MDIQFVRAISRISATSWSDRRIQRQIHVQPIRIARKLLCDIEKPLSSHLSKFLSGGHSMAVFWYPPGQKLKNENESAKFSAAWSGVCLGLPASTSCRGLSQTDLGDRWRSFDRGDRSFVSCVGNKPPAGLLHPKVSRANRSNLRVRACVFL